MQTFAEWLEGAACYDCGRGPEGDEAREQYEETLRSRIRHLERVTAMSPEEKARWDAEQEAMRELTKTTMSYLAMATKDMLRPRTHWYQFDQFEDEG